MKQDFSCFNPECSLVDVVRPVSFLPLGPGIYDNAVPMCGTCTWVMGAMSGPYEG